MYEDSWYSYVQDAQHKKEDASSKHRRRESLLRQPNGSTENPEQKLTNPIMELYGENPAVLGPPEATLVRRAKSYSDIHGVATSLLKDAKTKITSHVLEQSQEKSNSRVSYEDLEEDLLSQSQGQYQLYLDQLVLSERHLDGLLEDTTSALDFLATLSESFKAVDLETTAFQAQCEDLLDEQKRLRNLADALGTDLQYYAYLEPLTRRLNAPGGGRLLRSDDFLDMLLNLNACIDFMDQHPNHRDSTTYKTRYTSLLERSLNLVQLAFTSGFKELSDGVSKDLKAKELNETAEYIMLYGKYETLYDNLGPEIHRLLQSPEFAFGRNGDRRTQSSYFVQYHELYTQIVDIYLKSRQPVNFLVAKNLKKFTSGMTDTDFISFARLCIQHVLDVCHNEQKLVNKFFSEGPLLEEYQPLNGWAKTTDYAGVLYNNIMSHLDLLNTTLSPYLISADLQRICSLIDWLETLYSSQEGEVEDHRRSIAHTLLSKYLWKSLDDLFLNSAREIEHFKPTPEDLKVATKTGPLAGKRNIALTKPAVNEIQIHDTQATPVANVYPTVQTAVKLLVLYNEGGYERPRTSDVLYEIVHQVTESLQKAATTIKRTTGIMDAQLFLIKNLMLIENLFMTHEIPDVVRQSAEFDFSPIWDTIRELQTRNQLFNPLAYITPLVKGNLLPTVVDRLLDARKELEKVLVQQITAFTKTWQSRLTDKDSEKSEKLAKELDSILKKVFDDETTRAALWKMIRAEADD